jgi:hypothetical protein
MISSLLLVAGSIEKSPLQKIKEGSGCRTETLSSVRNTVALLLELAPFPKWISGCCRITGPVPPLTLDKNFYYLFVSKSL